MPDHSCCVTPLISSLNCLGIPGKPKSLQIHGTGPFCCPADGTANTPCSTNSGTQHLALEPKATVTEEDKPCCQSTCAAPLMKYFSTDAPHGFCGEACMDPAKFSTYHFFEKNLTLATGEHPCSKQWTPDNNKQYADYFSTVTHGFPGVISVTLDLYAPSGLSVTLDLYAPSGMPDHSCCVTPLISSLNCLGIPGKPKSLQIHGTGPFCCPTSATANVPC
eukprot:TRINITY_DN9985_c0_g1_i3.p1 TRINITY_DN9985_c0_g1~~TRINITY_DN9985_c0_g1_i3.p1  ORF type:complete len:239 (-),score=22.17 TRINITY_DN9985_c0_g1_i3:154-813(-)